MQLNERRKKLLALALVGLGDRLHQQPGLRAELWMVAQDLGCTAELMALGRGWVMHAAQGAPAGVKEFDGWLAKELKSALPLTDLPDGELRKLAKKWNYHAVVELERRAVLDPKRYRQADDEPRPNGSTAKKGQALETGVEEVP